MSPRLKNLLSELAKDFGKTTRWRVLCKERNVTSEHDQIELAQKVLAEPPIGSVAGGYAQWAKLHGAVDEEAPPYKPTGFSSEGSIPIAVRAVQNADQSYVSISLENEVQSGYHRIRGDLNAYCVRRLCSVLITQRTAKMLGEEILHDFPSGYISDVTYNRLSRWCHPERSRPKVQRIARELSVELFGRVIARSS